jgi:pimeloyl-ACP methyl ester carboxylesterase
MNVVGQSRLQRRELVGADRNILVADVAGPPDGATVLLMHGGGQTRHSWEETVSALAGNGFRAWAVDQRGHGESAWPDNGDYTLAAFGRDVAKLVEQIGGAPALVGASLGGLASLTALRTAVDQQATARCLALVDITHSSRPEGRARIKQFMSQAPDGFASLQEAADAIARYHPHRPRPSDHRGLRKNLRLHNGRWRWHWDPRFLETLGASIDAIESAATHPVDLRASAAALRVPTLLIRGRTSDIVSDDSAREFLELVPHAEYADVVGAGHMVAADRNDVFNGALLPFLVRHRA